MMNFTKKIIALLALIILSANCSYAYGEPEWQTQERIRLEKINTLKAESKRLLNEQAGKDPQWLEKNKAREEKINALTKESQRLKQAQMRNAVGTKQNKVVQDVDKMKLQYIKMFNSMKTCQPAAVNTISGRIYVLGLKNNLCNFGNDINTKMYTLCQFPMPIARKYAEESIKSINTGVESSYLKSVTNERYCKVYNK